MTVGPITLSAGESSSGAAERRIRRSLGSTSVSPGWRGTEHYAPARRTTPGHDGIVTYDTNEVGTAPPRGRPLMASDLAEDELSSISGKSVTLPAGVVVHGPPETCPACGSNQVMWGCDPDQKLDREEMHPLVWHETEWMADTFICGACDAGWIERDEPEAITWVRPYWRVPTSG